jgi:hypothetical protein
MSKPEEPDIQTDSSGQKHWNVRPWRRGGIRTPSGSALTCAEEITKLPL